ncbi:MAG TPA: DUF2207 domain-containing protein [Epsilonproteobacteria bacterium]|nr:DUF2207 domain-containing protein [Campylobacterota bacterium]
MHYLIFGMFLFIAYLTWHDFDTTVKPFPGPESLLPLILGQSVLLAGYIFYLFYLAKRFGSLSVMGSIVVRYTPPKDISLFQAGYLIDESNDTRDFAAAVIELADLGYLEIKTMKKEYVKDRLYLQKTSKQTTELTPDQRYFMEKILFSKDDLFYPPTDKAHFYQKFTKFDREVRDRLKLKGLLHFDIKEARRAFTRKAGMALFPFLIFYLLVTAIYFDSRLMILTGVLMLVFLIGVIGNASSEERNFSQMYAVYYFLMIPLPSIVQNWEIIYVTPMFIMPLITTLIQYHDSKITKFTEKGLKVYKELIGYREFILRTEVPRIARLMEERPHHVSKSLAYALLFKLLQHPLQNKL